MTAAAANQPPAQDTQGTRCASCGTDNGADRKFCRRCGQRLWEPCTSCQTPNSVDTVFCGACGTDLRDAFARLEADIRGRLERAARFASEGRFSDAASTLRAVPASEDSRLVPLLTQARQDLEGIATRRQVETERAEQSHLAVLQAMENHRYGDAQQLLQTIPPGLMADAMKETAERLATATREIETLTGQVRASLKANETDDLLPVVLRLRQLQPHDGALEKLALALQRRAEEKTTKSAVDALRQAVAAFQKRQYATAGKLLAEVEDQHLTESHRNTSRIIREAAWAVDVLKKEPFVMPELERAALRWQRLSPRDEQVEKILASARGRLAAQRDGSEFGLPWTRSPEETSIQTPVRWWRLLPRTLWPDDPAVLREHPSVFFTAFGLALQGLGLAKADVNLMPQPKGLLSRIAPLARGLSSVHDAWGIDLGSSCLKAVRLQRDKKTQAIRITQAIVEPHDASWSGGVDEAGFQPVAAATMERFLEQVEGKSVPAVLGFAGFKALGRWFELPPMKDSKLSEAVAYEAKMQIPIPIDEIVYDWQSGSPSESSGGQLPVTLLAARRDHLETWAALFQSSAIKPVAIQSTCLALYNAGQYVAGVGEKEAQSEVKSAATAASPAAPLQAWLEVGAETSNLVVGSSTNVRFRSLGLGSRKLERAVAAALKKDHVASRAALRYPAEDPAYHSITEAVLPAIEDLVQQVRRSLRSFAGDGLSAASLSVAGGGALQLGVLRRLVHGD